jgi:hypothetical protein
MRLPKNPPVSVWIFEHGVPPPRLLLNLGELQSAGSQGSTVTIDISAVDHQAL